MSVPLLACLIVLALSGTVAASARASGPTAHVSARCARVRWRSLRDGDQICPRTHGVVADVSWIDLRWSEWTRMEASGRGQQVHYDTGTEIDQRWPIRIKLTRFRLCPGGVRIYTRIAFTLYSSNGRRAIDQSSWSYTCQGSGGGGGQ